MKTSVMNDFEELMSREYDVPLPEPKKKKRKKPVYRWRCRKYGISLKSAQPLKHEVTKYLLRPNKIEERVELFA